MQLAEIVTGEIVTHKSVHVTLGESQLLRLQIPSQNPVSTAASNIVRTRSQIVEFRVLQIGTQEQCSALVSVQCSNKVGTSEIGKKDNSVGEAGIAEVGISQIRAKEVRRSQ